ncbi:3-deoxy-7-phosphoheptulonate synthase [Citrobacter amalonaticus]|uniref:Phospho-2-dehydro-3-deoxyheptonate aldolase n=1 Tax=Citrobacter amalonaticus TaxID=35703 RepID=A0A2S4S070_CITAM|nr:3-deoxy-7-phosphoheptulonate synthase [Citrobacter amalonaticus]POT58309.1 3-deoxy-7-phosphoheptulonate synthase [Citrobacter amalonaticus]POT76166.1 3-deoxy-7-phosphoheptulonate synthase [Citrobacter amalonaticus]POU66836.1 3-deoxy-7-phosphoheptulonate synthase [Citrobacter amalonaticus]POV05401.1 3-deoxy-7-phosphoheptulonate synthase [Citrobacter amalonaticus]
MEFSGSKAQSESRRIYRGHTLACLPGAMALRQEMAVPEKTISWISLQREVIANILQGKDPRLLVIVGPCSIHDVRAGIEYAERLSELHRKYHAQMHIVMRTYFEKPRTRQGWKGLMVDPDLDGSHDVAKGVRCTRSCLASIIASGVPTATEFLDPFLAPYMADLICWGAIGARTTESQPHRQMASGLHCPVGFKNSTDGNVSLAIDAIIAARDRHLLYVTNETVPVSAVLTEGNPHGHLILRGGKQPNYGLNEIIHVSQQMHKAGVHHRLIVDCSHGNSGKVARRQIHVAHDVINQRKMFPGYVAGIMLESFLVGGKQSDKHPVVYGQSITDECLSWQQTEQLLSELAENCASVSAS